MPLPGHYGGFVELSDVDYFLRQVRHRMQYAIEDGPKNTDQLKAEFERALSTDFLSPELLRRLGINFGMTQQEAERIARQEIEKITYIVENAPAIRKERPDIPRGDFYPYLIEDVCRVIGIYRVLTVTTPEVLGEYDEFCRQVIAERIREKQIEARVSGPLHAKGIHLSRSSAQRLAEREIREREIDLVLDEHERY